MRENCKSCLCSSCRKSLCSQCVDCKNSGYDLNLVAWCVNYEG